ncbi:MAG: FtsQ-type POTRA domain-containing protein [Bacteroidota bacterium]|nr:FtsQ-type POTRA domain-containing protein [Bacteroidota bacterium]MDP4233965.1 FtsQ-type POTRA domain-containing protein [Bacteroidota bacterium]MDP4242784.1 FtsQ-type POTRA domain-containing protein [Bacteroidota bacterium]MDP4288498.1 FtsQ-type POTRA domain-containing protein [Bacteroidota bacterium]
MRFTINPPKDGRKEFTNLPEREPDDLVQQRLNERRLREQLLSEPHLGNQRIGENPDRENKIESRDGIIQDYLDRVESTDAPATDGFEHFLDTENAEEIAEHENAEPSWRHSRWAPVLFVLAIAALGSLWYFASHFDRSLTLERIKVEGATLVTEHEIIRLAAIDPKQAFYSIDLRRIESRVAQHSLVKYVHVRRELSPATIVISIDERRPVAMLKSDSTGETYLIDRDGHLLRPKLLAGLNDPARLMAVPLLSGVSERDTVGFQAMAHLVATIAALDSGALGKSIGELRRTPAGSYVIYTTETQTPIFIGSPFDAPFTTALEEERGSSVRPTTDHYFMGQLGLLAKVWKAKLETSLRAGDALYVDARFQGQIILKRRTSGAVGSPSLAHPKISGLSVPSGEREHTLAALSTQPNSTTLLLLCNERE